MAKFTMEVDPPVDPEAGIYEVDELRRAVRSLLIRIGEGRVAPGDDGAILDTNGNTIGRWSW